MTLVMPTKGGLLEFWFLFDE